MYIRTISRRNKDGSEVRYVQLAHNVWDKEAKCAKAQMIWSFGREDELDKEALRRLARSIGRFLSPEDALEAGAGPLAFLSSAPLGGAWVLDHLWRELKIDEALAKLLKGRKHTTPVERAIFSMVAGRALAPSSKLATCDWVTRVAVPGVEEASVHNLYRAMDFLLEAQEDIQREVFFSVANLLNLEVDLIFFDTTSVYFECEEEDEDTGDEPGLRKRGYSRDKRPDLPQAVVGLAVTREGIPVRCWTWPGNTMDMSVIREVKDDLAGWRLSRVVTVTDRGFSSEDNLRYLQRGGGHYICGEKMRAGKPIVEAALASPGRYKKVAGNLEVKEITVGDGEARVRYVLVRNPERARRDKAERESIIRALAEELSRLRETKGEGHPKAACALLSHRAYGRYLKVGKSGGPVLDRKRIQEDERLDGKYLIRTSDDTLPAEDVALGYKQLSEVEAAFRSLKHTLDIRPVNHRKADRIKSHVLLCWLALLLIRVAENRCSDTWRNLRGELDRMHLGIFSGPDGLLKQRTETTPAQRRIFSALDIPEPPLISEISPKKARRRTA
jgi:hypothetical protein